MNKGIKKIFRNWLRPGRALRLQILLGTLVGASLAYILINLFEMTSTYQQTGSLKELWRAEWKSGVVLEVMQAGYTLNGRIVRPALVAVTQ